MMSSSTGQKRGTLGLGKDYYEAVPNNSDGPLGSVLPDPVSLGRTHHHHHHNHHTSNLINSTGNHYNGDLGERPGNHQSTTHGYSYNQPPPPHLPSISQLEGCAFKRPRKDEPSAIDPRTFPPPPPQPSYLPPTSYLPPLRFDSQQSTPRNYYSDGPRLPPVTQQPQPQPHQQTHYPPYSSPKHSYPTYSFNSELAHRPPTPAYGYPNHSYSYQQQQPASTTIYSPQLEYLLLQVQQQREALPPATQAPIASLPAFLEPGPRLHTHHSQHHRIQPPPPSPQAHLTPNTLSCHNSLANMSVLPAPIISQPPLALPPLPLPEQRVTEEPPCDDKDGHFLVVPDQELTPRYKIVALLGQGTFGRVAKCWDRLSRGYVAVKVVRAVPKYRDAARIEMRVLTTLKQHDPLNLNKCIHMNHDFEYRNHICMAFDLLGPSIFDFLKSNGFQPFPQPHVQQFARQILTSLTFIHSLGLVHTDLKPENILLVSADHELAPSKPKKKELKHTKVLTSTEIRLIDFGSATFESEYHSSVVSTRHYRAPEIILGMGWSFPCDMWSVGCILVELFTGDALFQTHENLEHLAMMQAVLGNIPSSIISRANKAGQKMFTTDGRLNYPTSETSKQSVKFVRGMKDLPRICSRSGVFSKMFTDLLQRLLVYDPDQRIRAAEALRHPFFTLTFDDDGKAIKPSSSAAVGGGSDTLLAGGVRPRS